MPNKRKAKKVNFKGNLHYTVLRVQAQKRVRTQRISGGNNKEVTPVLIPNTEVKLLSADDTWMVTSWESRSLPDL